MHALDCRYPVHVWRRADTKDLRIDTYDGVNSLVGSQVCALLPMLLLWLCCLEAC